MPDPSFGRPSVAAPHLYAKRTWTGQARPGGLPGRDEWEKMKIKNLLSSIWRQPSWDRSLTNKAGTGTNRAVGVSRNNGVSLPPASGAFVTGPGARGAASPTAPEYCGEVWLCWRGSSDDFIGQTCAPLRDAMGPAAASALKAAGSIRPRERQTTNYGFRILHYG